MFNRISRSIAITLTVLGLAFGSLQVTGVYNATVTDSGGQRGEIDVG